MNYFMTGKYHRLLGLYQVKESLIVIYKRIQTIKPIDQLTYKVWASYEINNMVVWLSYGMNQSQG